MQQIPIDQVGYDAKFYPRVNGDADWVTVLRYVNAITRCPWKADPNRKGAFPPIVVVKTTDRDFAYLILDGLHRLRAFHKCELEHIWATVERIPESKWMARSVELNSDSKRGLDDGDRAWCAARLQSEGYSVEDVSLLLQVPAERIEKLVATRIQKLSKSGVNKIKAGRGNREVGGNHYGFLKSPFIEAVGTRNAEKILAAQDPVSSRNQLGILTSCVCLLESGLLDMTDEEVASQCARIHELTAELVEA